MNFIKNKKGIFKILPLVFCYIISQTTFAFAREVIPVGRTVGITVEIDGVFVVGTAEFENSKGKMCSPATDAGLEEGDIILELDGEKLTCAGDVEKTLQNTEGKELNALIARGDKQKHLRITPEISNAEHKYKLGVWIKDASSGIGTITYYDPQTKEFGALGHGICDWEDKLTPIRRGEITEATIASVQRGENGVPGELMGIFSEKGVSLGMVSSNTSHGIKGCLTNPALLNVKEECIPVAEREEVTEGPVLIMSNIEGNQTEEFSAEILKINKDKTSEKGIIIKITDEKLLEKTGGIVRGMSGSPIIQNGKLVGAVTHVFVNDPTRGYGIFIENMLAEAEKIE